MLTTNIAATWIYSCKNCVFYKKKNEKNTFNCVFIFQHVEDVCMDVNQFCRFTIFQIFKLYILQSSQKCRFSCSAASHYYASNMAKGQLSFAEKLFKFIFIYLHLCFTFEYNEIRREVICLLTDNTMQCTSIIMERFSKSTCTRTDSRLNCICTLPSFVLVLVIFKDWESDVQILSLHHCLN